MRENAKNSLKRLQLILARNLKHITIVLNCNNFNTKIYTKIVSCAMFHDKQTKLELIYARKGKKRFKNKSAT